MIFSFLMRCALAVAFTAALLSSAWAQTLIPSQYIVYKNGGQSLPTGAVAAWSEPAVAYTAITVPMPFDALKAAGARVQSASVQVVMRADSPLAATGASVLLCPPQASAEQGYVGCYMLAMFAMSNQGNMPYTPGCVNNPGGPTPCRADVTQYVRNMIAAGQYLYLTTATYGNGKNGPDLWDVELLVNWELP